jgi:hypothetical protein
LAENTPMARHMSIIATARSVFIALMITAISSDAQIIARDMREKKSTSFLRDGRRGIIYGRHLIRMPYFLHESRLRSLFSKNIMAREWLHRFSLSIVRRAMNCTRASAAHKDTRLNSSRCI